MSHTGEAGEAVLRGNQAVDLPGNLPLAMVGNQSHTEGKEMIQPQRRAQGMHRGKLERGGGGQYQSNEQNHGSSQQLR